MTDSAADKESLLKRLAVILDVGDEDTDYVTDVLDQLIEIGEDVDDVVSYLTSFLGGDDDADDNSDLSTFANNIRRFKLGEEIIIENTADSFSKSDTKQQEDLQQQRKSKENQKKQQPVRHQLTGESVSAATPAKKAMKSSEITEKPKPKSDKVIEGSSKQTKNAFSSAATKDPPTQQGSTSKSIATKKEQKQPLLPKAPKELKKGKAKRICGCFGTKHKPLTNCLHCGRISCEVEGYDFCPHCHILIEDFSQRIRGDRTSSSALLHKERLLEFDRTAAARTHILDDQEDYFVSSNSMWSTQEEQNNARDKEDERRKLLHERQKQTLAINF